MSNLGISCTSTEQRNLHTQSLDLNQFRIDLLKIAIKCRSDRGRPYASDLDLLLKKSTYSVTQVTCETTKTKLNKNLINVLKQLTIRTR